MTGSNQDIWATYWRSTARTLNGGLVVVEVGVVNTPAGRRYGTRLGKVGEIAFFSDAHQMGLHLLNSQKAADLVAGEYGEMG